MRRFPILLALLFVSEIVWVAASVAAARHDADPAARIESGAGHRRQESSAGRSVGGALTADNVKRAIQKHLEVEWGRRVNEVQVSVLEPADPVEGPAGAISAHVVPSTNGEGIGRRMFQIAVTINGKPWKTIEALADVTAFVDAVVLNRSVRAEELIDASDLKMARVRIAQLPHLFITDREEVIGKSAARPLPADTPLRAAFVKAPIVVKKGDRVTIEAKRGGLAIQAYGVTKSSGHVGETVMVANLDSGREFRAKIVAPGLVQVEF